MGKVGLAVKAGLRGNAGLGLDGAGLKLGKAGLDLVKVGLAVMAGLWGNAGLELGKAGLKLGKVGLVTLVGEDAERALALSITVPTCIWPS